MQINDMFRVHFLGVRGSTPCSGPNYVRFGGHTSCVLMELGSHLFICDAGSGIVDATPFGMRQHDQKTHLLLSHTHLDHIMGLPFYGPIWRPDHTMHIYAGHLKAHGGVQAFLQGFFKDPVFPVPFEYFPSIKFFHDFAPGTCLNVDDVVVRTHSLNHPNGAVGYRIERHGVSVCYITDHEHGDNDNRDGLVEFIDQADLLIYDSTYNDQSMASFKGWGHSTWQEAIRLGDDAHVKKIAIFHHDPANTDEKMDAIEAQSTTQHPHVVIAKQGLCLDIFSA